MPQIAAISGRCLCACASAYWRPPRNKRGNAWRGESPSKRRGESPSKRRGESPSKRRGESPEPPSGLVDSYWAIIFLPPPEYPVSEKAQSGASGGSIPHFTRGSTRAMKPLAWHPGFAIRREDAILSRRPRSSGKPYSQPSAVRWAVEVSITTVDGFSTIATASTAAASGRHRNATSAELIASRLADGSLRRSSDRTTSSISVREERRSRTFRPVVPADPSMKTFFIVRRSGRQSSSENSSLSPLCTGGSTTGDSSSMDAVIPPAASAGGGDCGSVAGLSPSPRLLCDM